MREFAPTPSPARTHGRMPALGIASGRQRGALELHDAGTVAHGGDFSRIPLHGTAQPDVRRPLALGHSVVGWEASAERAAETVMRMPDSDRPGAGQRIGESGSRPPTARGPLPSSGEPLDRETRAFMETRFDYDFSQVRVHSDAPAARAARSAGALAYTTGRDIVFGAGRYAPATSAGKRLLAHELAHVVQQQAGIVPMGAIQCAPDNEIEVSIVEVSRAESDLLFHDLGIALPGAPPDVQFGSDGPIPVADRKDVQLAFNLAYRTAASPAFAAKFGEFKRGMGKQGEASIPGLGDLTAQKYLAAFSRVVINLADTSKNPTIANFIQEERKAPRTLPTAGFTVFGNDIYVRAFAIKEGRDALASLILHETAHVAGLPAKPINEFLEAIMETAMHGFEASAGLPFSQIIAKAASIEAVKPRGQGLEFTVSVTNPDALPDSMVRIEILDGNREPAFSMERRNTKFRKQFAWDGIGILGKPTESGIHTIRVVAGAALMAARDYVLRRPAK